MPAPLTVFLAVHLPVRQRYGFTRFRLTYRGSGRVAERTKATVTTDNVAALRQGTSGAKIQTSTETGNQHKYQTRVVSSANKVNLKFEEAKPVLEDQLAKSIANIL